MSFFGRGRGSKFGYLLIIGGVFILDCFYGLLVYYYMGYKYCFNIVV